MIVRCCTFGLLTLAAIGAAQAQDTLPRIVQEAIQDSRKDCEPDRVELKPGFIVEKDVNGDGRKDYVLDYGHFQCGESLSFYCGTGGCLMQVFASRPDGSYVKALDQNVRRLRFARVKGKPAMVLDLHGSACGKTGAEPCPATLYWNGQTFSATK